MANQPHDHTARQAAKASLLYDAVVFTGEQARIIACGFADATASAHYSILACAILPEHVHLVIERHDRDIETIGSHLKARASMFLSDANLHPFQDELGRRNRRPSPWSESFWQVYLDSQADIHRAVKYVENNPIKEGLRPQKWSFVQPSLAPALGPGSAIQTPRPKGRG